MGKKKSGGIGKLNVSARRKAAKTPLLVGQSLTLSRRRLDKLVGRNWRAGGRQKQQLKALVEQCGTPVERCLLKLLKK